MKLFWTRGHPAPEDIGIIDGAVVVHGSTAYFSKCHNVYSYTVPENKWTTLPQCEYEHFAMAVVNDALTTVGGFNHQRSATNALLSLTGSSWNEVFPPMLTKRLYPAAANTPTHLVVAGGKPKLVVGCLATVEVLNTETLQWSTACGLPKAVRYPQMTTCGGCLYLAGHEGSVFSCSLQDLLQSIKLSVWTRLATIPVQEFTLTTLSGRVLAIGGEDSVGNPTRAIHSYDVATNSWSVIGEVPIPSSRVLTAALPSNELVVVGGLRAGHFCSITEIGSS